MSKSAQKDWSPERRALEELSAEWREQLLRHPRLLPHDGVPRAETHEAEIRQKYVIACLERMGLPAAAERVRKCTAHQFCFCSGVKFVRRIILYFDPVNEIWDADALRPGRIKESNALEEQMGERGTESEGQLSFQKMLMTLISIMCRMAQRNDDGSVDEERRDAIIRGLHNITYQLWHWEPARFVENLKACLADIEEQQKHIHFWIDEAAAHIRIVDKDIHGGLPQASSRDVIALAVIMAMLVPEERQPLAMQSIALLMGQLFSWDPRRALEEINICLETWKQDGYRPNAWKDEQGLVHVDLPKKMTD